MSKGRSSPALSLIRVSKRFGGLLAVSEVSFDVAEGSFTAIIGPNGAGKTTLFNLITNLVPLTEGSVSYFGRPLHGLKGEALASIGLIRTFQSARVFPGVSVIFRRRTLSGSGTRVPAMCAPMPTEQSLSVLRTIKFPMTPDRTSECCFMELFRTRTNTNFFTPTCVPSGRFAKTFRHC